MNNFVIARGMLKFDIKVAQCIDCSTHGKTDQWIRWTLKDSSYGFYCFQCIEEKVPSSIVLEMEKKSNE